VGIPVFLAIAQCGTVDVIINSKAPQIKAANGKLISCKKGKPRGGPIFLSGKDQTIQRPATAEEVAATQMVEDKVAALNESAQHMDGGSIANLFGTMTEEGVAGTDSTTTSTTLPTDAIPNPIVDSSSTTTDGSNGDSPAEPLSSVTGGDSSTTTTSTSESPAKSDAVGTAARPVHDSSSGAVSLGQQALTTTTIIFAMAIPLALFMMASYY